MNEEITNKVANALVEPYQLSDWKKHNIYLLPKEKSINKLVADTIYRYKREYIMKMIEDLKNTEAEDKTEIYQKIIKLTMLKTP